ncbi:uncharacterized protein TEOVI_000611000 [Trypanosoma equiperdum]|uniref:Uncharacterized protein n=1 Tax=Trypanosoma equiperdum TaxID=5694 RepID=A0A1G4I7C9_TRYEQ|nr:hypothetical protein, conserved [Trypanosoma equiperdum]
MLVAVREFRPDEARRVFGGCPRMRYTINNTGSEVTIADVTDSRAHQVLKCDLFAQSNRKIFDHVVLPVARAILPPFASSESVIVVDGTEVTRNCTLFDATEGLLAQCCRLFMSLSVDLTAALLEAVSLTAMEFGDDGFVKDLILGVSLAANKKSKADLGGSSDDHASESATALLQDVSCCEIKDEYAMRTVLECVRGSVSSGCSQLFGLSLKFAASSRQKNTTLWFVSLSASERARSVCSTRHCIVTAAQLLECRAPHEVRITTALSSLVEPALLGRRPGLWVSCFAPATPVGTKFPETFRESYRIAATGAHVYASRNGISTSCSMCLLKEWICACEGGTATHIADKHVVGTSKLGEKTDDFVFYTTRVKGPERQIQRHMGGENGMGGGKSCLASNKASYEKVGCATAAVNHRNDTSGAEVADVNSKSDEFIKGCSNKCHDCRIDSSAHGKHRCPRCPFEVAHGTLWFRLFVHLQSELDRYARREHVYRRCVMSLKRALVSRQVTSTEAADKSAHHKQELPLQGGENNLQENSGCKAEKDDQRVERLREEFREIQKSDTRTERALETFLEELQEERRRREANEEKMRQLLSSFNPKEYNHSAEDLVSVLQKKCEAVQCREQPVEDAPKAEREQSTHGSAASKTDCAPSVEQVLSPSKIKPPWMLTPSSDSSLSNVNVLRGSRKSSRVESSS